MIGRAAHGFVAVESAPSSFNLIRKRLRVFDSPHEPTTLVSVERVAKHIVVVRGEKVMLDADLAETCGVETKNLNKAVHRNRERFPTDFMFQLTEEEADILRSQFVTSDEGRGGRRYLPYAFTEQGVAMLSSHAELARKIGALEAKYDHNFRIVFDAIRNLMADADTKRRKPLIGFLTEIGVTTKKPSGKSRKPRAK